MFNVYTNQQNRQTGSRNLMGPKTLPTIWYTYMMFVTKYQISAINSYWEKCDETYLGRTDRRTEVKQHTSSPFGERGYNKLFWSHMSFHTCFDWFKKLMLFSYVLNLKIVVVLKASRAVVNGRFSLNEVSLVLFLRSMAIVTIIIIYEFCIYIKVIFSTFN